MADVQLEKGHVRIANPVIEALALAPFNGGQARVFLAIIRATWGWRRKEAELSTADLAEATGLARSTAAAALRDLVDEGVVLERQAPSFAGPGVYQPQKDPTRWGKYAVQPPALSEDSESPESRTLRKHPPETPESRTPLSGTPETPAPESVVAERDPDSERHTDKDRKDSTSPDDGDSDADPPHTRTAAASGDLVEAMEEALGHLELGADERRRILKESRKITTGLDLEAWKDPKGSAAPEAERPRLLQLAVLHWDEQERRIPFRSCLRYVVAQQLDPFVLPQAKAPPDSPAGKVLAHRSDDAARNALEREREAEREADQLRIQRWRKENADAAAALQAEVEAKFDREEGEVDDSDKLGKTSRRVLVNAEVNRRIAEILENHRQPMKGAKEA